MSGNGYMIEGGKIRAKGKDFQGHVHGFYYDEELDNPLLTMTLHPNRKYNNYDGKLSDIIKNLDKHGNYVDFTGGQAVTRDSEGKVIEKYDENDTSISTAAVDNLWSDFPAEECEEDADSRKNVKHKYWKKPIARAILNEDFNIDVQNIWTNFGGDPIGDIWNQQKSKAPYAEFMADALRMISAKTQDYIDKKTAENGGDNKGTRWLEFISNITKGGAELKETQKKYYNRSLVVNGTKFTYYSQQNINFNNMVMKYTIFPNWDTNGNTSTFVSVFDQVELLLPYVMGDYIPVYEVRELANRLKNIDTTSSSSVGTEIKKVGKGIGESAVDPGSSGQSFCDLVEDMASWQLPPGGFEPDLKYIDNVQKGTLKLRFGSFYSLDNLVISGCNFNFSKTLVKNPTAKDGKNLLSPLWCDVTLQLRPATLFSKESFMRFVKGDGTQKTREILETRMKESLDQIKNDSRLKLEEWNVFKESPRIISPSTPTAAISSSSIGETVNVDENSNTTVVTTPKNSKERINDVIQKWQADRDLEMATNEAVDHFTHPGQIPLGPIQKTSGSGNYNYPAYTKHGDLNDLLNQDNNEDEFHFGN